MTMHLSMANGERQRAAATRTAITEAMARGSEVGPSVGINGNSQERVLDQQGFWVHQLMSFERMSGICAIWEFRHLQIWRAAQGDTDGFGGGDGTPEPMLRSWEAYSYVPASKPVFTTFVGAAHYIVLLSPCISGCCPRLLLHHARLASLLHAHHGKCRICRILRLEIFTPTFGQHYDSTRW